MTNAPPAGVVVDTMVISCPFDERPNPLAERYRDLIGPAPVLLAFQTVMELRFGAIRAGWGELRRRRLERRIAELTVLHSVTSSTTATAGSRQPPSASPCDWSRTTASSRVRLVSSSSPPLGSE
jgi:hypothetical protein